MPLLSVDDLLPWTPRRVLVTGTSGAGKTTLSTAVAQALGLPRVELDALHHGPGWVPRVSFAEEVAAFVAQPRWVTEWQYTDKLGQLLSGRADTVIWLDHPRPLVMWQVTRRTLRRRWRRELLWNGNIEPALHTLFTDPEHVIRWAWRTHAKPGRRVAALLEQRGDQVAVVRLRGRAQVGRWLRRLREGCLQG
ncbi:adenylate kinase [Catellatospora methionotrophica]|uniref:Adenylate kinase n=1 Tax=Catellatospora methionotrophica TaxID=121620 RepID=A0A8J3LF19_9ACTN|nr:AAA family ATPase [Catellatospora methionotrophica]GIG18127.1 adenylate kinase [Catellatospora methionotrophica]